MLLRESGELSSASIGLDAVLDGVDRDGGGDAGVLLRFAEAIVRRDHAATRQAREALVARIGADAMVDAAAVASNFERMTRIADATGITLGERLEAPTAAVRRSSSSSASRASRPRRRREGEP